MSEQNAILTYKGRPLLRKDDILFYGSMTDSHIVMLQILSTTNKDDLSMATRVAVQLQLTDPDAKPKERILKRSEKDGLYAALDVGCVWLSRALNQK
ncbi:MAG: hypothetical protein R3Y62_06655 [Eubacteriales bacterium]